MSENEVVNFIQNCQVPGCDANSSSVVVYSAKRSKNVEKYNCWLSILKLPEARKAVVYACQRHFPAGAPTVNNPDPSPKLFNPIPKVSLLNDSPGDTANATLLDHSSEGTDAKIIGPHVNLLPSAIFPPPRSVIKLAPNVTLIDLKKIREEQDLSRPIRIEEVTVLIDEKDTVKVVDYGPRKSLNKFKELKIKGERKSLRRVLLPISQDNGGFVEDFDEVNDEPDFRDFEHPSLGFVLEQMRQLRIDCNTGIVDVLRRNCVYAHRSVLVAKSPYFYRQLYLKRRYKNLYGFSRFTLPFDVDFEVVDAVVSFIYTGSLDILLGKNASTVKKLFSLFEMKESLEMFTKEVTEFEAHQRTNPQVKTEPEEEESVLVLPFEDDDEELRTPVIEVCEAKPESERKRKRKTMDYEVASADIFRGRFKVSVQKIVENTLDPLLGKIAEMLSPSSAMLQSSKTSQNITTLWHADILLTKLFTQGDLVNFFSDVMGRILDKSYILVGIHAQEAADLEPGSYTVNTLSTQTGNPIIDESYSKPYFGAQLEQPPSQTGQQPISVGNIAYVPHGLSAKHIPKYVHLIALHRFNIFTKKKGVKLEVSDNDKDTIMPSLLETDGMQDDSNIASHDLDDLMKRIKQDGQLFNTLIQSSFQKIHIDLKRRVTADLELYINTSFHEELIMHIILGPMNDKHILPLSVGIFLAKECNFCRKKECRAEDLSVPISPDNPVCPDRECIKRNLVCELCNKQMSTSKSLARHKYSVHNIDTGDTNGIYICSHCGDTFSKKWKLNIHERDHEDRKMELVCRYCKKKIRGSIALKKHVTMVHETKPQYSCDYCPKLFKRRETLCVHRRIHTGEKPYRCRRCDYASETKGNLKAHVVRKHKMSVALNNDDRHQHHVIPEHDHVVVDRPPHTLTDKIIDDPSHRLAQGMDSQSNEMVVDHVEDDQVMAATIVAHTLSDGSFIITSETSELPMEP